MTGIDIAIGAQSRLHRATGTGVNGPTMQEATDQLGTLSGTKAELTEAIAYLALQVAAYRRIANEDAALAVLNIEHIVKNYRDRRGA